MAVYNSMIGAASERGNVSAAMIWFEEAFRVEVRLNAVCSAGCTASAGAWG